MPIATVEGSDDVAACRGADVLVLPVPLSGEERDGLHRSAGAVLGKLEL